MSGDMPGMDHGSGAKQGTEHGSADKPGADSGGHGKTAEAAPDRPLAPVLGTFGGASAAVMLSAAFLGRKDRAISLAKAAARAAGKAAR